MSLQKNESRFSPANLLSSFSLWLGHVTGSWTWLARLQCDLPTAPLRFLSPAAGTPSSAEGRTLAAPLFHVHLEVSFFGFTGVTAEMQNLVHRRIYPFLLMVVVLMGILSFQVRQFKRLYEHIKNDK